MLICVCAPKCVFLPMCGSACVSACVFMLPRVRMCHFERFHHLLLSRDSVFNRRENNCVFISPPEITIVTVKWITILDIFPKRSSLKGTVHMGCMWGLFICDFSRWALPSIACTSQTNDSFSLLGEGRKKGDTEERVNSWMWKARGAKETAWQGILSTQCSSPCWGFKLLAERRNIEFMQQVFACFLVFFTSCSCRKRLRKKTDSIHKSSHLCSHLVCASNCVTHKVWIYFLFVSSCK